MCYHPRHYQASGVVYASLASCWADVFWGLADKALGGAWGGLATRGNKWGLYLMLDGCTPGRTAPLAGLRIPSRPIVRERILARAFYDGAVMLEPGYPVR